MDFLSREKLSIPRPIMDVLEFEYTDWKRPLNPFVNRDEYVQVRRDASFTA
jgi:hypothetical protein